MRVVLDIAERVALLERRQQERREYVREVEALIARRQLEIDNLKRHL